MSIIVGELKELALELKELRELKELALELKELRELKELKTIV